MPPSDIAVSVRGLSKSYTIARNAQHHTTAAEAIVSAFKGGRKRAQTETFWALRDIEFDIRQGDVVGIIGRNGAGKSTLLKILSRVTEPTAGRIDLYGRVGSLLEVGTGFHPELTGRENIFLNGAILGMGRREITRHFDEIVSFAEVDRFLDTPVKRYSSGMYVRLAFAVAAHLEPEILIVDEVLAVGDAAFQKKCLKKMQSVAEQEGRTILFVSHNMGAVNKLCSTAIFLESGRLSVYGSTEEITKRYLSAAGRRGEVVVEKRGARDVPVAITRMWVADEEGTPVPAVDVNRGFRVGLEIDCRRPTSDVELTILVQNQEGQRLFMCNFSDSSDRLASLWAGGHRYEVAVPAHFLAPGTYYLSFVAHKPMIEMLDRHEEALAIEIVETGSRVSKYQERYGDILVRFPWTEGRDSRPPDVPLVASN